MRKLFFILFQLISAAAVCQKTEATVKHIRQRYDHIQKNISSYDTLHADVWGSSAEGGEVRGYYDKNKKLVMMDEWLLGETGKTNIKYYLDNEKVVFVLETRYRYNRPLDYDSVVAKAHGDTAFFDPRKTRTEENRYYFDNKMLIRWLDETKNEIDPQSPDFPVSEKGIVFESDKAIGLLRERVKKASKK